MGTSDQIKLPPEALGGVGERLFETLCLQAGLVANKSTNDVMGWDFIVEFPLPLAGPQLPLDRRQSNSCRVQLKSTVDSVRASLSLSAAERLAKDPRPAVIVVFRLNSDGTPVRGHLIHLIGDNLAQVLKRLRMAQNSDAVRINRSTITFPLRSNGKAFELSAEGLKAALAAACGTDPAAYVEEKQRQLDELGYEDGRFEAEAIFRVEGREHLAEVLMGLTPVRPLKIDWFDRRFDIRIPYTGSLPFNIDEGIYARSATLGPCTVAVRGGALGEVVTFETESIVGPPFAGFRLVLRHNEFDITLTDGHLQFQTRRNIEDDPRSLDDWISFFQALAYMLDSAGTMQLFFEVQDISLPLPSPGRLDGPFTDQIPAIASFLTRWRKSIEYAGVSSTAPFSMDNIWEAQASSLAANLLTGNYAGVSLAMEPESLGKRDAEFDAVYVQTCTLADASISYAVRVRFGLDEAGSYRSTSFTPLHACRAVSDLSTYATELAERNGIETVLLPDRIVHVPSEA